MLYEEYLSSELYQISSGIIQNALYNATPSAWPTFPSRASEQLSCRATRAPTTAQRVSVPDHLLLHLHIGSSTPTHNSSRSPVCSTVAASKPHHDYPTPRPPPRAAPALLSYPAPSPRPQPQPTNPRSPMGRPQLPVPPPPSPPTSNLANLPLRIATQPTTTAGTAGTSKSPNTPPISATISPSSRI